MAPEFPYDAAKFNRNLVVGDAKVQENIFLGKEWIKEDHVYHDWENLKFLRDIWEGHLVVKGISSTHVRFILFLLPAALTFCSGCGKGTNLWRRWDHRIRTR